ncbi:MAG: DUF2264 domain-containing protein [Cephaloticoccus sp.]|nr:DUF2264 domain-containing protein [Cephaloticoccus sp.]MCF7761001.1 DUF2264 domain-containing protein [Cephaloticoccus sp.]
MITPVPAAYRNWQQQAKRLLEPLAALMQPGLADLSIKGIASDHDAQADRLESFARPLVLAAHYLHSVPDAADHEFRDRIAQWFRSGLVIGSDPTHPAYWGPDASYHQHHVEMGLMTIGLQIAPAQLWTPLTQAQKDQVARWLGTCRGGGIVNNNHLFMSVHILEFLGQQGYAHRTDRTVIDTHLRQLETMHRGGGWFEDGINQAFDHYNAYAFHFYGLWWARLHGDRDPARATRWREWTRQFVDDYQYFFAASGEHPAFGRSICYRFNAINVFGLAVANDCTGLPLGRLRRLCTRNLDFFLSRSIYQEQGCLSVGWTDRFDAIAEVYSCAASPYWCAKGFAALTIPPDHPFWHVPEEPLPAELGDFARAIAPAGLLVRGVGGEVEILNAGSMVGNTQLRYGAWKWSKLAYRTGVGFTLARKKDFATDWSLDSALTQETDDGRVFGRHSTVCVEMDEHHLGYSHGMGSKIGQVSTGAESFLWWKSGWLLHVHQLEARQPVTYRLGGYALPMAEPGVVVAANSTPGNVTYFHPDGRGTVLQPLHGFSAAEWDNRTDDSIPRRHIHAPYHVCPILRTARTSGATFLAALSWTGNQQAEAQPWHLARTEPGKWLLQHPTLGLWEITHWSLPALA